MSAAEVISRPVQLTKSAVRRVSRVTEEGVRGRPHLRVIVLFAAVEALASADQGTVGAVAPQLEHSLHISDGQIGIIAAVAALAGAVGTLPAGMLTDRVHRLHLLSASILLWSAAMVASAFAPSFLVLVLTRVALGAVTATSGPTVASLIGDFFLPRDRARIWGLVLTGELLGAGIGVVGSGNLAAVLSWRYGFGWLAVPGVLLAAGTWRLLSEPARGAQGGGARRTQARAEGAGGHGGGAEMLEEEQELAQEVVREHHEAPHDDLVLHSDPVDMPLPRAVRYVLTVRTNRVLILAAAMGYLFFAGVQTFAVLLLRSRYGLGQSAASSLLLLVGIGGLVGVVLGGRLADRMLAKGRMDARVLAGAGAYLIAAAIFVPALLSPVLVISMPLFVLGATALAGRDPPVNAARLDIMHPRLWGRAEGVRTVLQMLALAAGPLIFGFLSGALGGPSHTTTGGGAVKHSDALAYTFLIMLLPVALGGIILLRARRTYPRDVATATASVEATTRGRTGSSVAAPKAPGRSPALRDTTGGRAAQRGPRSPG